MKDLIEALNIFLKYGNPAHPFHCERYYLHVDIKANLVSEEDKLRLKKLGFFPDEEHDTGGFDSYKYGNC